MVLRSSSSGIRKFLLRTNVSLTDLYMYSISGTALLQIRRHVWRDAEKAKIENDERRLNRWYNKRVISMEIEEDLFKNKHVDCRRNERGKI